MSSEYIESAKREFTELTETAKALQAAVWNTEQQIVKLEIENRSLRLNSVPLSELRKAIDPIAGWFDIDGEVNDPIPLLEVVEETAKMLVAEREDTVLLESEIRSLREALKQARHFAKRNGYTMREFSERIGITAAQLSAWTDEIPDRQPEFKD